MAFRGCATRRPRSRPSCRAARLRFSLSASRVRGRESRREWRELLVRVRRTTSLAAASRAASCRAPLSLGLAIPSCESRREWHDLLGRACGRPASGAGWGGGGSCAVPGRPLRSAPSAGVLFWRVATHLGDAGHPSALRGRFYPLPPPEPQGFDQRARRTPKRNKPSSRVGRDAPPPFTCNRARSSFSSWSPRFAWLGAASLDFFGVLFWLFETSA